MDENLIHTEETLNKFRSVLERNGFLPQDTDNVITDFLNTGLRVREVGPEFPDLELEGKDLEEAVFTALGAASSCWENLSGAGVFESDRCKDIGEQLMKRIRQASPIYG